MESTDKNEKEKEAGQEKELDVREIREQEREQITKRQETRHLR
jgi:hypothetical protein